MFPLVKHLVSGQNQFASGGLLLMLVGSVGVFLRSVPEHLWSLLVRQTTMTITVKDDDAAFQWVKEWFREQNFLDRVRRVDLDTTLRGAELALIPAPGTHFFWHAGRPFWVSFLRSDTAHGRRERRAESLTFQTLGRNQLVLRAFVAEIVACHHRNLGTPSSLHIYDDYWALVQVYSPRLLDSVVLKPGEKERLVEDLEHFRAARERYRRLGIPYYRGYLLYGPPGTGKTSLVSGLAANFGMSIYALNLTEMTDRSLKLAINDVPENSVILFEDIDGMQAGHRRPDRTSPPAQAAPPGATVQPQLGTVGVTLSGLLNVLDGFHAPENVLFVMTTNNMEALDPALLRPGRIDYKLFMGNAAAEQKIELFRRFFPNTTAAQARQFAQAHQADTMAEFQGMLLRLELQHLAHGTNVIAAPPEERIPSPAQAPARQQVAPAQVAPHR